MFTGQVMFLEEGSSRAGIKHLWEEHRVEFEQPGCLHAGMDLYKHAFRLAPLVCSDLVADCFELAWDIRELDMRASPYDLAALGYTPVRIEDQPGYGGGPR